MGIVTRRLLVPSLLALATVSARAQFGGLPVQNVEYNPLLFINPQIQRELRLSPAAAAGVQKAFMDEAFKIMPILTGGGGKTTGTQERTRRIFAGVQHMQTRLASMLTTPQRLRLRQLTLQSIGASAALQPKVAAQLGLSKAQRNRLGEAVSAANDAVASKMQRGMSGRDLQNRMPEMTRLQAQAKAQGNQALLTILTPAQRSKWKAMLGKPFNLNGFLGVGALGLGE